MGGKVVGVKSQEEVSRMENGTRIPDGSYMCFLAVVGLHGYSQHNLKA